MKYFFSHSGISYIFLAQKLRIDLKRKF